MQNIGSNLEKDDRVLVLGASGWFGSTAVEMALSQGATVMGRTSTGNIILGPSPDPDIHNGFESCLDFEPTIVIDCAFATRNKISSYGKRRYLRINNELMKQSLLLQKEPGVRRFIGVSSGAALPFLMNDSLGSSLDLYGFQKAHYERELTRSNGGLKSNVVLVRPWSMSGRHCKTPELYALFDLISQSKTDRIVIRSESLVYRRYTDVGDLLKVALMVPVGGEAIDSGGELLEIADLANLVVDELGSEAAVSRISPPKGLNSYHSDNSSWESVTTLVGLVPKTIREQIRFSAGS